MTSPKRKRPTRLSRKLLQADKREQEAQATQIHRDQQFHSQQLSPMPQGVGAIGSGLRDQNCATPMAPGQILPQQPKPVSILSIHERVQKAQERLYERRGAWQDAIRALEQADPLTCPAYTDLVANASSLAHEYVNASDHFRSIVGGLY